MRYSNPQLRDSLAAEYVIGTLRAGARARFESLLRYDPSLRRLVAEWEARLTPLAAAAGDIAPPARLWKAIAGRIARPARIDGSAPALAFWRGLALTGTAFALLLATYVGMAPHPEAPVAMVAVMSDDKGRPAMVVSWPQMKSMPEPHIRVKIVMDHPTMTADQAWELWMLPGGTAAPVSLGLITTDVDQVMKVRPALAGKMGEAWGIAMSVEPRGGSRTGAPTGPVVFKGQCVKIL